MDQGPLLERHGYLIIFGYLCVLHPDWSHGTEYDPTIHIPDNTCKLLPSPCVTEYGVPNGTLSQDYVEGASGANSQGIVDVDMPETVALPAVF